jgi:CO/xanthine dehydrogenase FAD-binding subunit
VQQVRLAAAGLADRPLRLVEVEEALVGVEVGEVAGRARVEAGSRLGGEDHHAALAAELAGRALDRAVAA